MGLPVCKETLALHELPLPETAAEGSKQLFAFFHESGMIKEPKIRFNIHTADSQGKIDDRLDEIEKALKGCEPLKSKLKKDGPTVDDIMETMKKAVGKIKTIPCIEISYEELSEYFKTGNYPPEIEEFRDNVFFQLLECTEKKSWWDWNAFIVAMLGIAQIIAGVLLEVFTVGAASYLAMALISEGVGDIAFAIEAGINKNFSWKAYGIQKAISIAISIATAGVGAWLSRGAQVATKVVKTGFQLFKAVGKTVLKNVIKAVAFALSDIGIEKLLDYIRQELLNSVKGTLSGEVDKQSGMFSELMAAMDLVYTHSYEKGQAEKVILDTFATVMENIKGGTVGTEIYKHASKVTSEFASQMGTAASKMFKHGSQQLENMNLEGNNWIAKSAKLAKMAKHVTRIVKIASILKTLCEMAGYSLQILQQLILKLKAKAVEVKNRGKNCKNPEKNKSESFTKFKENFVVSVKVDIVDYIMSQVQTSMVQPAFNKLTHSALEKAAKSMSAGTKSMLKSLKKDKNVQILAEFQGKELRRSNARNDIKDNFDVSIQPSELDPDTPVRTNVVNPLDPDENKKVVTLSDAAAMYGDSLQLYKDKQGDIYIEKPPYEQFVKTFGEGKTAGAFELMLCAKFLKANIKIEDETGQLQQDGKPAIIKGGKKNDPAIELVYSQNPDGTCYFNPKVNGELIVLPESDGKNSLYQALNLAQQMKGQGSDGNLAIPLNLLTDSPTSFVKQIQDHALRSSTMRGFYKENVHELAHKFQVGTPQQRTVTNSTDIRKLKLSSGNKLTRTTSLPVPRKSAWDDDEDSISSNRKIRRTVTAPPESPAWDSSLGGPTKNILNDSPPKIIEEPAAPKVTPVRSKTLPSPTKATQEGFVLTGSNQNGKNTNDSNLLLLQEFKVRPKTEYGVMTREEFFKWFNEGSSSLMVQEFKVSEM